MVIKGKIWQGKMENENFNVKAPLLLFPVKIERNPENIVLKNDIEIAKDDIKYQEELNKENGIEIKPKTRKHIIDNYKEEYPKLVLSAIEKENQNNGKTNF